MLKKDERTIIAYIKDKYGLTVRELKGRKLDHSYFYICKPAVSYDGFAYLSVYNNQLFDRVSDCLDFITKRENNK